MSPISGVSACGLLEGGGWWRNRRPQGTGLHGQAAEPGQLLGCSECSVGGRHLWAPVGLLHSVETQVQHSLHNAAALLRPLSEEVNVTSSAFSLKEYDILKRVLGCVFSGRGEKYIYFGSKCLLGGIAADLTAVSSLRLELRILKLFGTVAFLREELPLIQATWLKCLHALFSLSGP